MAIEKYATEGFVLTSFESGEHDKTFKLFTREFGLILARATSIRKLESKLRAHLHTGRISYVTLVKGKEIWRITGSEEVNVRSPLLLEITKLLERFVRGDGVHKKLFDHMRALATLSEYDDRLARMLAYYLILVNLGYADARMIGAENLHQYKSWSISDLYTQLILTKDVVRPHVMQVLKDIQL
jgi:hypothetical protein